MEANVHSSTAKKAREIYIDRLKQNLESTSLGQFVAIEADSGDYFLGSTPLEAIDNGKGTYPDKTFHVIKVGHKAGILLKGRSLKWEA